MITDVRWKLIKQIKGAPEHLKMEAHSIERSGKREGAQLESILH